MPSPSRTVSPFLTNRVPPSHSSPQTPASTELYHLLVVCLTFPLQGSVPAGSRSGGSLHLKSRSFFLELAPSVLVLPFTDKAPSLLAQYISPQHRKQSFQTGCLPPFQAPPLHGSAPPTLVQAPPLQAAAQPPIPTVSDGLQVGASPLIWLNWSHPENSGSSYASGSG